MRSLIALLAMTSLTASPSAASVRDAAFSSSADRAQAQSSVFAGATWRVGLDRRTGQARGRASLALAGMTRTRTDELKFGQGLQLSGGQTGKPALFLGGRDVGQMQKHKANLSGTTTAIIVGGVLVLGVVAALVISDYQKDERCIGEEGDCD